MTDCLKVPTLALPTSWPTDEPSPVSSPASPLSDDGSKTPERRRRLSLAARVKGVVVKSDKRPDEIKDKQRKHSRKEIGQTGKGVKGKFSALFNQPTSKEENRPEVSRPTNLVLTPSNSFQSIVAIGEDIFLTDVYRPKSPRQPRNSGFEKRSKPKEPSNLLVESSFLSETKADESVIPLVDFENNNVDACPDFKLDTRPCRSESTNSNDTAVTQHVQNCLESEDQMVSDKPCDNLVCNKSQDSTNPSNTKSSEVDDKKHINCETISTPENLPEASRNHTAYDENQQISGQPFKNKKSSLPDRGSPKVKLTNQKASSLDSESSNIQTTNQKSSSLYREPAKAPFNEQNVCFSDTEATTGKLTNPKQCFSDWESLKVNLTNKGSSKMATKTARKPWGNRKSPIKLKSAKTEFDFDIDEKPGTKGFRKNSKTDMKDKKDKNNNKGDENNNKAIAKNGKKSDSGIDDDTDEKIQVDNEQLRKLMQHELDRTLKGRHFHPKLVQDWSKNISERIVAKVKKITRNQRKIAVSTYIGEKLFNMVEVSVKCYREPDEDNFVIVSTQINDIYAWVSLLTVNL